MKIINWMVLHWSQTCCLEIILRLLRLNQALVVLFMDGYLGVVLKRLILINLIIILLRISY